MSMLLEMVFQGGQGNDPPQELQMDWRPQESALRSPFQQQAIGQPRVLRRGRLQWV